MKLLMIQWIAVPLQALAQAMKVLWQHQYHNYTMNSLNGNTLVLIQSTVNNQGKQQELEHKDKDCRKCNKCYNEKKD